MLMPPSGKIRVVAFELWRLKKRRLAGSQRREATPARDWVNGVAALWHGSNRLVLPAC